MKKLRILIAVLAAVSTAWLMTSCGGDDDDDDNGGGAPAPDVAPQSFANRTITLTEGGQSRTVNFAVAGDTFTAFQPGTTNVVATGTFQWVKQANNVGQLILTTTDVANNNVQVTYVLTFNTASSGTYTFSSSAGQTGSGTFSNLAEITGGGTEPPPPPPPPTDGGGTEPPPPPPPPTDGTGTIPTSLSGKVIDFTATGLGNERLTFGTDNTVTSDILAGTVGNFTFTPAAGGNTGTLVVTFPNGDNYNLNMSFTDAAHGTWSGNQFFDGSDHPVPAGSAFTIQN